MDQLGLGCIERALGFEHVQKIDQAAAVAIVGEIHRPPIRLLGFGELFKTKLRLAVGDQSVFDLFQRNETEGPGCGPPSERVEQVLGVREGVVALDPGRERRDCGVFGGGEGRQ